MLFSAIGVSSWPRYDHEMALTTGLAMTLPVVVAADNERIRAVNGSCFSIGGDLFITAGHVAEIAQAEQLRIAVHPSAGPPLLIPVAEADVLPNDIGLFRVPGAAAVHDRFLTFPWRSSELMGLTLVRSIGYAYGLRTADELEAEPRIVARGFQGYVVSQDARFRPLGGRGEPFRVYELSFAVPRGQSGSPLFDDRPRPQVCGVVIGNSTSKMLVFNSEERIEDANERLRVEHYESLNLGIAVQVASIVHLRSRLMQGSIAEHLRRLNLLHD